MSLEGSLADQLVTAHPLRAAAVLERVGVESAAAFLKHTRLEDLARVVPLLSPQFGNAVAARLDDDRLVELLGMLSVDFAARIVRGLGERAALVERLPDERQNALSVLLRYPPDSAGGLMDPGVLALPSDTTASDALESVREFPRNARYNVYVLDREGRLLGVLNLRELLLAKPETRLVDLMVEDPHCLPAEAGRSAIVMHRGWREAHSLPVVDADGHYLGAIRYRTFRDLEQNLLERESDETSEALGALLSVGARGMLQALTSAATPGRED